MTGVTVIALVPVYFGLALGYFAGRRGLIDSKGTAGLNTFVMSYAMPAALFLAAVQMPRQTLAFHGKLFLVVALASLLVFCAGLIIEVKLFKLTPADSSAMLLTVASPQLGGNWLSCVYRALRSAGRSARWGSDSLWKSVDCATRIAASGGWRIANSHRHFKTLHRRVIQNREEPNRAGSSSWALPFFDRLHFIASMG